MFRKWLQANYTTVYRFTCFYYISNPVLRIALSPQSVKDPERIFGNNIFLHNKTQDNSTVEFVTLTRSLACFTARFKSCDEKVKTIINTVSTEKIIKTAILPQQQDQGSERRTWIQKYKRPSRKGQICTCIVYTSYRLYNVIHTGQNLACVTDARKEKRSWTRVARGERGSARPMFLPLPLCSACKFKISKFNISDLCTDPKKWKHILHHRKVPLSHFHLNSNT